MGSDLYMEERNFRPRPNKAQWELVNGELELVIYRDVFYHGWQMVWHGDVNDSNESLVKVFVKEIPPRPKVTTSKEDRIVALLNGKGPISEAGARYIAQQIMKIVEQDDIDIPRMELK